MNKIVNKFLLAGDGIVLVSIFLTLNIFHTKFMPKVHLRQSAVLDRSAFTYSACGPFTKNKGTTQKFKETGDSRYIYQNKIDGACFRHDMAYGCFKDLYRRTACGKVLYDKAFNIVKNPKYDV